MRKQIEKILCKKNKLKNTYFKEPMENCLPLIKSNWGKIEKDLSQGSGNELKSGKFRSIGSSSAMGVNAFGAFYSPSFMTWPSIKNEKLNEPAFEKKLSNGLRGTNPNLDVVFENDNTVLAIECKFLETLGKKKPNFSDQYLNIKDGRRDSKWFGLMLEILNGNIGFRYLDAAQLIKHYFGLANKYSGSNHHLEIGYVFWEPDKTGELPDHVVELYADHQKECIEFASFVAGDKIQFSFYSYFELIDSWMEYGLNSEMINHFESFGKKYRVNQWMSFKEPERLRRGKAFHKLIQKEWQDTAEGNISPEKTITKLTGRGGRIDIFVDDDSDNQMVSVVEVKASDWDRMRPKAVRRNALRQVRQIWSYIDSVIEGAEDDVCPGVIFPKRPTNPNRLKEIEKIFNDFGIAVVWHDESNEELSKRMDNM